MDKREFVMIVMTAVITIVSTKLVEFVISVTKSTNTTKAITAKLKIIFSKTNRAVFFDMLMFLFFAYVFIDSIKADSAWNYVWAIISLLFCISLVIILIIDIIKAIMANQQRTKE